MQIHDVCSRRQEGTSGRSPHAISQMPDSPECAWLTPALVSCGLSSWKPLSRLPTGALLQSWSLCQSLESEAALPPHAPHADPSLKTCMTVQNYLFCVLLLGKSSAFFIFKDGLCCMTVLKTKTINSIALPKCRFLVLYTFYFCLQNQF